MKDALIISSPPVGEDQGGGNAFTDAGRLIGKDISILRARNLRNNQTDAEKKLWHRLRRKSLGGVQFRRQAPIGKYIVDFACYDPHIVIELDGGQHANQQAYDGKRDAWLRTQGFLVLRFWNHEVIANVDGVIEVIVESLNRLRVSPLPGPPPQGGRES